MIMKPTKKKTITRASAVRRADTAFSLYIRTRDSQEFFGEQFRCISCGRILPIEQADAGHYVNRSHNALRYSEENVHAQCRHCNRFDEGNMSGYRRGLLEKIGEKSLIYLEAAKNQTCHLGTKELLIIADYYRNKTKEFIYQISKAK